METVRADGLRAAPWIPNSDWPLRFADLQRYYRETAKDYDLGDLEAEARRPEIAELRRGVAAAGLKSSSFYWEASPLRTPNRFADEFARSERLRVVTGATATEIILDAGERRVSAVACACLEGRRIRVRGDTVILATGALETPRLLLASNRVRPAGVGNDHDLVGRYYTDHPKHHSGALHPGPLARRHAAELQYGPKPRFAVCFALDDATQRTHGLLEHSVYLKPLYGGPATRLRQLLLGRGGARDAKGFVQAYRVLLVCEQVPTPESRAMLAAERDALGVPKLKLDWRLTERDAQSLALIVELLEQRLPAAGIGALDFGDAPPSLETMSDAAHQMGTTRMATDPRRGVVDTDCRVFGTENLYVVSSSVFPTGPTYSPTFTILALARRLVDHLAQVEEPRAETVEA